jgi:hypothetical protein
MVLSEEIQNSQLVIVDINIINTQKIELLRIIIIKHY